jgi:NAD(P)-dependent dehydrogenase (short-subunit alcohol dehydrogenase family)
MGDRLEGKVAIITGAGSGIGRATALRFAEEGAKVVVVTPVDVGDPEKVRHMVENAMDQFGNLDILVNSAAALQNTPLLQDTTEADWDKMIKVNLRGTFLCSKYAIPAMLRSGSGAIVNVGAASAFRGPTPSIPYEVAKAGVNHLTRASAYQYTPLGIRINCIAPGNVETPMLHHGTPDRETWERRRNNLPMKRFGTPEELANAILFVASDEASWISGVTIIVDGGRWATMQ